MPALPKQSKHSKYDKNRKPSLLALFGCLASLFALTASKCDSDTIFPPFVKEICTDTIDNDSDGKIDCEDSDCASDCNVTVVLFPPPATVTKDSLTITGTHVHAASISVSVTPSGGAGSATLTGGDWTFTIKSLSVAALHTVIVRATSASGKSASDTATFTYAPN